MKPVIYQLVIRYFANTNLTNQRDGSLATNGCGKFNDITDRALHELRQLGITHIWLTGALRQATMTDYSSHGLPADDPDIVKGIAGSFFAVRDYYDVSPDYASAPELRMREFEALIERIHACGMQVLLDFVPNHVSRAYESKVRAEDSLGSKDDRSRFFSPQNNYFYLPDQPALRLVKPSFWNPPGVVFDGQFALEDGSPVRPVKATGNNVASSRLTETDWYETIKLNYGYNFQTRTGVYDPEPRTWHDMDRILAYWQAKGVDGFRCDFAHYIPQQAWVFLISHAKQRRTAFFLAEAYPYVGSGDPIENQSQLVEAGFDAVYFYQAYNSLKLIYTTGQIHEYDRELQMHSASTRCHLATYLENHDERRVASPIVRDASPAASGFGSAEAGYQLAPMHLLYSSGPALLLNGQEVGESGAGAEGFSGDDGRTTIYDYWAMPEFSRWVAELRYDGSLLSSCQKSLRDYYSALLHLCQHASIRGDGFWSLLYFNNPDRFSDCPDHLYSYARFETQSGDALVVAVNLSAGRDLKGQLRIPGELADAVGMKGKTRVKLLLDRNGAREESIGTWSSDDLARSGFWISIPNQTAHVYSISSNRDRSHPQI